jgi:ATP-dependent Clp protease ATP-binding subunit ClpC
MFERFTERARQIVVLAQDEARGLGHDYVGAEHILLGLLREPDGMAGRILRSCGMELEAVREQVVRSVGRGGGMPMGQVPFTKHAKKALEGGLHAALELGHNHIATEHILLGLAAQADGPAAEILAAFGLDSARAHAEVVRVFSGGHAQLPGGGGMPLEVGAQSAGEPPLAISCPRCGGPLVTFVTDEPSTGFHVAAEGDHTCPDCGRTWAIRYAVSWSERPDS